MTDAPATPKADAVPPAKSSPGPVAPVAPVAPVDPAVELRRLVAIDMERRRAGFQAAMAEAEKQWGMRLQTMARPFIDDAGVIRVDVQHLLTPIPEVPS